MITFDKEKRYTKVRDVLQLDKHNSMVAVLEIHGPYMRAPENPNGKGGRCETTRTNRKNQEKASMMIITSGWINDSHQRMNMLSLYMLY